IEKVGAFVVGYKQVQLTVSVEVDGSSRQSTLAVAPYAGGSCHLRERPIPIIMKQRVGDWRIGCRTTDIHLTGRQVARHILLNAPITIAGDIQIQEAVPIIVKPDSASGE